jgi:glutathione S-transferase
LKLYTSELCPFAQRVRIGLRLRGLEGVVEEVEVDLDATPPAELTAINPQGSVPTLAFAPGDGFNESLVLLEFLDSLPCAGPKLFGATPREVGKTKVLLENASTRLLGPVMGVNYSRGNAVALRKATAQLPQAFEWISAVLATSGGPFLAGATPAAVDASVAPFLARYVLLREIQPDLPMPRSGTPAAHFLAQLLQHPAVASTSPTFAQMAPAFARFAEPEEAVRSIQRASRALVSNPEEQCAALNQHVATLSPRTVRPEGAANTPLWTLIQGEKGPHIHARFRLPTYNEMLQALELLTALQETTDHHTAFVLEGYHALDITLCTHEPVWGLSGKDFSMAQTLTEKLLRI